MNTPKGTFVTLESYRRVSEHYPAVLVFQTLNEEEFKLFALVQQRFQQENEEQNFISVDENEKKTWVRLCDKLDLLPRDQVIPPDKLASQIGYFYKRRTVTGYETIAVSMV